MGADLILTRAIRVGDREQFTVPFIQAAADRWEPGKTYALNAVVRSRQAGFEYKATTDGQSGKRKPIWPRTLTNTVDDGSVVWTAQAISTASLGKTLASVAWTVPTGLTSTGEAIDATEQSASAYLEATAAGTYEVIITGTFNDTPITKESFSISIEVT